MSFMRWTKYSTGIEDLGLYAASKLAISVFSEELRNALLQSQRLESAIKVFCGLAESEQSDIYYRIVRMADSGDVWIGSSQDTRHACVDPDVEWFSVMSLVTIVRRFTDDAWTPSIITFRSDSVPGQHARYIFPDSQFRSGQKETGIMFPASLLNPDSIEKAFPQIVDAQPSEIHAQGNWDFPTSLQKLLQVYLDDGYPGIKLAARLVGISVRTLQRRLSEYDVRYSELVHQAQINYAMELLADKDLRTLDVAYAVGYRDPSNFARAFRRISGITPQQYRSQNSEPASHGS